MKRRARSKTNFQTDILSVMLARLRRGLFGCKFRNKCVAFFSKGDELVLVLQIATVSMQSFTELCDIVRSETKSN